MSEDPPEINPCNFETEDLHCGDCPENCKYCASFGIAQTNRAGFGGKECRHKTTETARCYCCQIQVKLALKIGGKKFSELVKWFLERKDEEENVCVRTAVYIHDEMVKPVLARIDREREQAG
jgi:hypothetical protein